MTNDFSYGILPLYRDGDRIEILLIQHGLGHWGFPKGHAEGTESPLEAAQREFEEEAGISTYQVDEKTIFSEEYLPLLHGEVVHKTVQYFPAWVSNKQVKPQELEVQDYGWFTLQDAKKKVTYSGAKKILRELKKYLEAQATE